MSALLGFKKASNLRWVRLEGHGAKRPHFYNASDLQTLSVVHINMIPWSSKKLVIYKGRIVCKPYQSVVHQDDSMAFKKASNLR